MHIYFKFTQPLFVQALIGISHLYDAKDVSMPASGDLQRPVKAAGIGTCSIFTEALSVSIFPNNHIPAFALPGHLVTPSCF
ncbi:hypothetical protein CVT25_000707 [Psilocybe cyanescens]|uniref:Uncharacterized protein n=1 Tax=Psilocybe cyanescens TaxID=93625 RepID=A0A409XMI6_PSICY|nr:hypothetical protein CVT25_000707 [Psilocybe cyanescens]